VILKATSFLEGHKREHYSIDIWKDNGSYCGAYFNKEQKVVLLSEFKKKKKNNQREADVNALNCQIQYMCTKVFVLKKKKKGGCTQVWFNERCGSQLNLIRLIVIIHDPSMHHS